MARFAVLELRAARAAATWPSGSRPTARATRRSSGASSSGGWSAASCSGVVATDALELGIDIGALDAAICVTFPGTVASLRQMWGRAGRRGRGLAIYVAGEDALDQFFCRHPDEFLERPGRGRDPRPRERAALRRAPAVRGARGAAGGGRRARARAALARVRRGAGRRGRAARAPRRHVRPAPRRRVPGGAPCRCAARAATRWRSSTPSPAR